MRSNTSSASKVGSGVCERVGGPGWRLTLYEGERARADPEALEQGVGDVKIDLVAACMDAADLVDHLGASGLHFVADVGRSWYPGRGGAFAGFGHDLSA
jgi:hypothetical protein